LKLATKENALTAFTHIDQLWVHFEATNMSLVMARSIIWDAVQAWDKVWEVLALLDGPEAL
jgi:hypothetical protein